MQQAKVYEVRGAGGYSLTQQAKVYEVRGAGGCSPDAAGQSLRGERRRRVQP